MKIIITKEERDILLKSINLLIEVQEDSIDYTKIIHKLKQIKENKK